MTVQCPKCGTNNVDGAVFCASCGAALTSAPPGGTPPPYSAPPPSYTPGPKASYTMAGAFSDAIALLRNPVGFMAANRDTPATRNQILINYVAPLAAITFIATLIGHVIFLGGLALAGAFVIAILSFIFYIAEVYIVGYVINALAVNFRSMRNEMNALKLASYVFTPFFIASILAIIPFSYIGSFFEFLGLLYGLYILYKGLPIMVATPQDQVLTFTIVIVIVSLVIFAIIGVIIGIVFALMVVGAYALGYYYF